MYPLTIVDNSRLTQVFFVHLDCDSHPLQRMSKKVKFNLET